MNYFPKKSALSVLLAILLSAGLAFGSEVIQTQESDSWDEVEVDLTSLKIKNNIVTAKFKIRNNGSAQQNIRIDYKQCYLMDEANQKKYYVLKDSDGLFIAGPNYDRGDGGRFWFDIQAERSKGMWMKFPEPADNPETISISIPKVFPFEEIELTK